MTRQTAAAAPGAGVPARHWLWAQDHGRRRGLLAMLLALLLVQLDGQAYLAGARLDERNFDVQARWIRAARQALAARAAPAGASPAAIVLVGIDEAGLDALSLPLSLMHAPLGEALEALASARPRLIGLDVALPDRSYDGVVPGVDRALMRGLLAARTGSELVVALDADARGRLRVPYAPLLAAAGGTEAFGLPLFPLDCDGTVRRFEPDPRRAGSRLLAPCRPGDGAAAAPEAAPAPPTFAGRVAQRLGRADALARAAYIDYTRASVASYVPLQDLVRWYRQGDSGRLQALFAGRVVLVGSVLPYLDRLAVPVALDGTSPSAQLVPGMLVNAQIVANAIDGMLVRPAPEALQAALVLLAAALALPGAPRLRAGLLAAALVGGLAVAMALHATGWFVRPGAAVVAALAAVLLRTVLDLAAAQRERARLAGAFGGYLSPDLLQAILGDTGTHPAQRRPIALLFADLRDFTARSEAGDPLAVHDLLNRYYAAVTPVLHAHGGTIDNFRGDGIMVMFGAPLAQAAPCDAALAAAADLLARTRDLNDGELRAQGIAPVAVTIGLAYGEAVYGELGSADRRDYTALGDAVNVAAHLQGVAKRVAYPVVMTQVFAQELQRRPDGFVPLGVQPVKGHTPLPLLAWRPPGLPA